MGFARLGLPPLWVQSAKRCGFLHPTPIQEDGIPAVLKGRDVLALSKTGTGKTLMYLLPVLNKLDAADPSNPWTVLILLPTKELVLQVCEEFQRLLKAASVELQISAFYKPNAEKQQLQTAGPVVICTPRQILSWLKLTPDVQGWLENLEMLIVDEADLLLSYGYDADMKAISTKIPRACQCVLTSATQSGDLQCIVKLVRENPVTINLLKRVTSTDAVDLVTHWHLNCGRDDKALYLYVLLLFQSVERPVLIFVNGIDEGYRLHLFLDCFRVKNALLHRELPQNSRKKRIEDFNRGKSFVFVVVDDLEKRMSEPSQQQQKTAKEAEFGVTRGLDFKNVKTVVNYDLPQSLNGYLHRVGRTGRAGKTGAAVSFFTSEDATLFAAIGDHLEDAFRPFRHFDRNHVDGLKYRASEVLRALTPKLIREARQNAMRQEVLRAAELAPFFATHPKEKRLLEGMATKNLKRQFADIAKLPSYITAPQAPPEAAKTPIPLPKIDPLTAKTAKKRRRQRGRS